LRRVVFRSARHRALIAVATACLGLGGAVSAIDPWAASAAGTGSVAVQTSYENTPISLDMSDAVGYAITNTTGQTETLSFTDALPYGVAVDNPAGVTDTPGTSACVLQSSSVNPGAASVSFTVEVPPSSVAGTVCTISAGIVPGVSSAADSPLRDSYSAAVVSPSAAVSEVPAGLVVLSNPVVSLSAPGSGQVFTLGQLDDASFSRATTDPLDSIDSFFGTDDEGNQVVTGEPIDTVDPGNHSLEVDCYSAAGGGDASETVAYSVKSYTLTTVKTTKTDYVSFKSTLPAGKLVAKVIDGTKIIGTTTDTLTVGDTASVTVKPSTAGAKVLKTVKGSSVKVELEASFTPAPIGSGDNEIMPAASSVVTKSGIKLTIAKPKAKLAKNKQTTKPATTTTKPATTTTTTKPTSTTTKSGSGAATL
jgi:hypothetical protein